MERNTAKKIQNLVSEDEDCLQVVRDEETLAAVVAGKIRTLAVAMKRID